MKLPLTTGDMWDDPTRIIDNPGPLEISPPAVRETRGYIERFRARIPLARIIHEHWKAPASGRG